MSDLWYRIPEWCAGHDDPAELVAIVWLLGRWHLGAEPSVSDLKRQTGWGWDRCAKLADRLYAWAPGAGARHPETPPRGKTGSNRGGSVAKAGRLDTGSTSEVDEHRGETRKTSGSNRGASHGRVLLPERETEPEEREDTPEATAPAAAPGGPSGADASPSSSQSGAHPKHAGSRPNEADRVTDTLAPNTEERQQSACIVPDAVAVPKLRPPKPDDALTLWTVYRQLRLDLPPWDVEGRRAKARIGLTPTPAGRKAMGAILAECEGLDRAAVYLAWVHESRDHDAKRLRGEVPWPDGELKVRIDPVSLGRGNIPARLAEADAWEARGRREVQPMARGAPPGRGPPGRLAPAAERYGAARASLAARAAQADSAPNARPDAIDTPFTEVPS